MSFVNGERGWGLQRSGSGTGLGKADSTKLVFQESDYTWEQVVRILRKHRGFALAAFFGIGGAALLLAVLLRDVYRPVARLDLEPPSSGIRALHEIESATPADNQDYLETQVQILKSDALAMAVIRQLGLASEKDQAQKHPSLASVETNFKADGALQQQLTLATLTPAEAVALDKFRKNLSVELLRNTRLVEVGYSSHDPALSQQVTNAVVARFIDDGFKHRYTTTMQVSDWLSGQLDGLRKRLQDSNQAVSDYQKKYGLIELDDRDVPMSQLMSEVNHQLSEAQANRIEAEAFDRMVQEGQGESIPAMRDDVVLQNLLMRYADLRAQLAQAKTVYGDANVNVKKIQEQSEEISKQITAERSRVSDRLHTSFVAAKERERLMLRDRERIRAQMGDVSSQMVGYHVLKNEAMANAELYNTLQARLQEAGIYAGLKSSNVRVVDLATNLQKPTSPNRALIVCSGLILGSVVALLGSFVRESFDNTVRTPDDVTSWVGLRSLALLPSVREEGAEAVDGARALKLGGTNGTVGRQEAVGMLAPRSAGAEAMRDLRTSLLGARRGGVPGVVLISSATEKEGKTTVAMNLAMCLAQLGRTCLVDGDLRQPEVSRAFGLAGRTGLAEVLSGSAHLTSVLFPTQLAANLWVLPSGHSTESPADTLSSARISDLCADLRKSFDYVVIDSPPVIRFSDARTLAQVSDAVVLVSRYGMTTRRAMQRTAEILRESDAPVAGFVLNDIDLSSSDYHYFAYGYSKAMNRQNPYAEAIGKDDSGPAAKSKGAHA